MYLMTFFNWMTNFDQCDNVKKESFVYEEYVPGINGGVYHDEEVRRCSEGMPLRGNVCTILSKIRPSSLLPMAYYSSLQKIIFGDGDITKDFENMFFYLLSLQWH